MENTNKNLEEMLIELTLQVVHKAGAVVSSDLTCLSSNILALKEAIVLFDKKARELHSSSNEADAVMRDFFGSNY